MNPVGTNLQANITPTQPKTCTHICLMADFQVYLDLSVSDHSSPVKIYTSQMLFLSCNQQY